MTLIVEIEDFLKEARCHIVDASANDTVVMICVPQITTRASRLDAPKPAAQLDTNDDDLITWEDAAWQ